MFPDADMHGIDLVLPDFTCLREHADRIEAVVATHGHEDHVGGLSYLLRDLSFPIYGSPLTLGLARNRIEEAGLLGRTELIPVADGERRQIGPFDVEFIPVTHSVPHAFAIALHTPQGVILHSGDFKLDLTPVDGRVTDLARIGAIASGEGIRLLCATPPTPRSRATRRARRAVGAVLQAAVHASTPAGASSPPASPATSTASSRSPTPPSPTAARSPRSGCRCARTCGWPATSASSRSPTPSLVDIEDVDDLPPGEVCVISTGSPGRADVGAVAAGPRREPLAEGRRPTTR